MDRARREVIVWARYTAWLLAPVEKLPYKFRYKGYKDEKLKFPEVSTEYMVQWLQDMGKCVNDGMGVTGFSWTEIRNWADLNCVELDPWEATTLRDASFEYAAMLQEARDIHTKCPWAEAPPTKVFVDVAMRSGFAAIINAQNTKKGRPQ